LSSPCGGVKEIGRVQWSVGMSTSPMTASSS
jgi:hypothetical protein